LKFFIYPFYFTIMILSASMLGETAGAGTHQSKSKKGRLFSLVEVCSFLC